MRCIRKVDCKQKCLKEDGIQEQSLIKTEK